MYAVWGKLRRFLRYPANSTSEEGMECGPLDPRIPRIISPHITTFSSALTLVLSLPGEPGGVSIFLRGVESSAPLDSRSQRRGMVWEGDRVGNKESIALERYTSQVSK